MELEQMKKDILERIEVMYQKMGDKLPKPSSTV